MDPKSTALLKALVQETQARHLFTQRPARQVSELETQKLSRDWTMGFHHGKYYGDLIMKWILIGTDQLYSKSNLSENEGFIWIEEILQ